MHHMDVVVACKVAARATGSWEVTVGTPACFSSVPSCCSSYLSTYYSAALAPVCSVVKLIFFEGSLS